MKTRIDFVQQLEFDLALKILESLDDPSNLIRASAVSRFWHHFVILNQISKKLFLRLFPQLSGVVFLEDSVCTTRNSGDLKCSSVAEWKAIKIEHMAYAFLARTFTTSATRECIAEAVSASSTDSFPEECILNTLYPLDKLRWGPCYWSSKGENDPEVPETLIYKLLAKLCVITEINIKPFVVYFQPHNRIFSAKAVRFRMGHPRDPSDLLDTHRGLPLLLPADNRFVWTYTSPEFPMDQDNVLQRFKLPEPVLCIGGYIQIELLGRVQRHEMDDLYYICVSHVKAMGEPLFPKFDIEILEPCGKFLLKYFPENQNQPSPTSRYGQFDDSTDISRDNLRALNQFYNRLHENEPGFRPYGWNDDEDDNENDFGLALM